MFEKFIHRPVLAIVLAVLTVFVGVLAMRGRPISQFPEVSPPRVMVSLAYPGASAQVLVESSLITLERAINGVPGMSYIISDATSAGEATIQVVFELDTDPNQAMVNVKNRVDQMMSRLPQLVQLEGVIVNYVQPSMLMYVNLYSTDIGADQKFLYNFANVNLLPELARIRGIGRANILGSRQYAMRVWLNPDRMRAYNVSTEEVMKAIDEQSVIGRPGRLGQATGKTSQALEYVLTYEGRYNKPEQYENIIIRAKPDGELLRMKDIATVELGSEFFDIYSNIDGHPSAAIVLKQNYGSNASEVIANVKAQLDVIKASSFPAGMDYEISYDVSAFLDASIEKVVHTLAEAFVLVALVVFIFLGDWRSTLIPTLAVPISLIGSFMFMQLFDISINLITLFALVLAIGVVVDDAIVVVEAVHAKMAAISRRRSSTGRRSKRSTARPTRCRSRRCSRTKKPYCRPSPRSPISWWFSRTCVRPTTSPRNRSTPCRVQSKSRTCSFNRPALTTWKCCSRAAMLSTPSSSSSRRRSACGSRRSTSTRPSVVAGARMRRSHQRPPRRPRR